MKETLLFIFLVLFSKEVWCSVCREYNYSRVLELSHLFYQAQRSGDLDVFGDYDHERIPYRRNSALSDGEDNDIDLSGGYHDGGDYVKFNYPLTSAVTLLSWGALDFQGGYVAAGQQKEVFNTIRWATDYLVKCHPQPNLFYAQVGDAKLDHEVWNRIENKSVPRPSYRIDKEHPGSDLASLASAAFASSALLFAGEDRAYALDLLEHAVQLFQFAVTYRGRYSDSVPEAADFYESPEDVSDDLGFAAAWLYKATRDENYLNLAKKLFVPKQSAEFSWRVKNNGLAVLLAQLTNEEQYVEEISSVCDAVVTSGHRTPKGLVWIQPWGSLRHAANMAFICLEASNIKHPRVDQAAYIKFARSQINYALGDTGRSFVVGFGEDYPLRPHHTSASCPADLDLQCSWDDFNSDGPNPNVLWGALVGGPNQNDEYEDRRDDYVRNEVTIGYNAGLQSAVAALNLMDLKGVLQTLDC